jgi:hypothetical protein
LFLTKKYIFEIVMGTEQMIFASYQNNRTGHMADQLTVVTEHNTLEPITWQNS